MSAPDFAHAVDGFQKLSVPARRRACGRLKLLEKLNTSHDSKLKELQELCAEPHAEDGIAPHILKKQQLKAGDGKSRTNPARTLRYCKAIHHCLDAALASLGDDRLTDLAIHSVEPLRSHAKLLVVVIVPNEQRDAIPDIEDALKNAGGLLRSAVASEIRRKRTPHLSFRAVAEADAPSTC